MNDVPGLQHPALRDDGLSGWAAALARRDCPARFQNPRPAGPVNGSVHTPPAKKRRVGRVHNRVGPLPGDVALLKNDYAGTDSFAKGFHDMHEGKENRLTVRRGDSVCASDPVLLHITVVADSGGNVSGDAFTGNG
jgi:hypothetical protein